MKRARRRRPAVRKTKLNKTLDPEGATCPNPQKYRRKDGATPKDKASAKESNSTPKSDWVLVKRATIPSKASTTAAIIIKNAANKYLLWKIARRLRNPKKMLIKVKKFGKRRIV